VREKILQHNTKEDRARVMGQIIAFVWLMTALVAFCKEPCVFYNRRRADQEEVGERLPTIRDESRGSDERGRHGEQFVLMGAGHAS
jgi:hypothetical protein